MAFVPNSNVNISDPTTSTQKARVTAAGNMGTESVGNVASAATDAGSPVKVGGKYNATAPTFTDGQRGDLQLDANGNTRVTAATRLDAVNDAITAYPLGHTYTNITTATTTTIKTGPGILHALNINTPVASGTITMYDNTAGSGTKIATFTFPGTLLSSGGQSNIYDIAFSTGLTIVTTGTQDITVSWR